MSEKDFQEFERWFSDFTDSIYVMIHPGLKPAVAKAFKLKIHINQNAGSNPARFIKKLHLQRKGCLLRNRPIKYKGQDNE